MEELRAQERRQELLPNQAGRKGQEVPGMVPRGGCGMVFAICNSSVFRYRSWVNNRRRNGGYCRNSEQGHIKREMSEKN